MHRHDALAGPGRARDPCRPVEVALDCIALGRVQEDEPLLPRPLQRLGEGRLIDGDPSETRLSSSVVGMCLRRASRCLRLSMSFVVVFAARAMFRSGLAVQNYTLV
jgi:hypothetical protein